MREHQWAILSRCSLKRRADEQAGQRSLAHRQRVAPQVVTIQLDQIERKEEGAGVMAAIADAVEGGDAILAADHRLAVDNARKRDNASTIRGKRSVRSLPGRLYSFTRLSSLRAITRKPSCLISCSHSAPQSGCGAEVGRQGATKPAGKAGGPGYIGNSD